MAPYLPLPSFKTFASACARFHARGFVAVHIRQKAFHRNSFLFLSLFRFDLPASVSSPSIIRRRRVVVSTLEIGNSSRIRIEDWIVNVERKFFSLDRFEGKTRVNALGPFKRRKEERSAYQLVSRPNFCYIDTTLVCRRSFYFARVAPETEIISFNL